MISAHSRDVFGVLGLGVDHVELGRLKGLGVVFLRKDFDELGDPQDSQLDGFVSTRSGMRMSRHLQHHPWAWGFDVGMSEPP